MRSFKMSALSLIAVIVSAFAMPAAAQVVAPVPIFLSDRNGSGSNTTLGLCAATGSIVVAGGCVQIQAPGAATVLATITGTYSGPQSFQCLGADALTWTSATAYPQAGGPPLTSTSATGATYVLSYAGCTAMRVIPSGAMTGAAVVAMEASAMPLLSFSVPTASITGGAQTFTNAAVTGAAVAIKGTIGQIYSLHMANTTAATAWLQLFCLPFGSVTLGTTAPNASFFLPTNAGAGFVADLTFPTGICAGGTGLSVAGTTTATGNTGAAIAVVASFQ